MSIHFELRGLVGLATIDRQERRNALHAALCDELRRHLANHPDLRAIVVTGAGSAFCSGADLVTRFSNAAHATLPSKRRSRKRAKAPAEAASTDTFRPAFERVLDAIVDHPAPVIAALNGPAIGAGMQLAVACDLRVAALGAHLAIPGGRLGIHLSARNVWRLAMLVGQGAARDFLLTGRSIDAEEALRIGLVQRVTSDALGEALAIAGEIATSAPFTVQGHKRALNLTAEAQWLTARARAEIAALEARAFASEDLQEGMAAFAEKRTPNFKGR